MRLSGTIFSGGLIHVCTLVSACGRTMCVCVVESE